MNTRLLVLWTMLALAALPILAQPAFQVEDINPGAGTESTMISFYQRFATLGPGGIEALADMTGQTHLIVDVTGYFK